jgi:drug/metabolite transporter (DMT)-like permease|tara:strand:- start:799 stop:1689 length:891 start_codon:yes stop_codon:yes gene_type:complete
MSIPAAYTAVILVWATTPLGITWSGETIHPILAALLRMAMASVLGVALLKFSGIHFPWHKRARRTYALSCIGVFGGMFCTYLSAHYLSSGVISVMYGLTPIFSGLFAWSLLKEQDFGPQQWLATLVSLGGLVLIFSSNIVVNDYRALLLLLLGVVLFSISGVLVKRESNKEGGSDVHPFAVAVGAITTSIPAYGLAWLIMEKGQLHIDEWGMRSILAIIYLAIFGSLIGFFSYFYVLRHLPATTVALVTLITPVFAVAMGYAFNEEALEPTLIYGGLLVMAGLGIYFWGGKLRRIA